jgi:DNA modification methylase|tara:strand:+ start:136 stop:1074 length:939 start_codon:yes stop_codon:yes gene_type:complete
MNYLYSETPHVKLYLGDVLEVTKTLPDDYVNCIVTSPPYYSLRDYQHKKQIGLEATPELYVNNLVKIFKEIKRVLKKNGTVWLNLGDTYADSDFDPGKIKLKPKDLMGVPWKVAFALQKDGWYLRSDIIWQKNNSMPEPVKDRPTRSHEYIFLLSKSAKYYYDADAIKEPSLTYENRDYAIVRNRTKNYNSKLNKIRNIKGNIDKNGVTRTTAGLNLKSNAEKTSAFKNKRDVWNINTKPYKEAHFAVFPEEIPMNCIKAGSKPGDIIFDPFVGSGTTLLVAQKLGRKSIGIDIKKDYLDLVNKRTQQQPLL